MKTEDQKKKDVNALIKFILSEMEELAGLPPEIAGSPYAFQDRKQQLVRRIWRTFKDVSNDANT